MRMTKQLKQHIIKQMTQYIADVCANAAAELADGYTASAKMMAEDAALAQDALDQFKKDSNWNNFYNTIFYQDTLPREECIHYLLKDGQAVGLTLDRIC